MAGSEETGGENEGNPNRQVQLEIEKQRLEEALDNQIAILGAPDQGVNRQDILTRIKIIHIEIENVFAAILQNETDDDSIRLILNEKRSMKLRVNRLLDDFEPQQHRLPVDNVVTAITDAFNNFNIRLQGQQGAGAAAAAPQMHQKPAHTTPIPKPEYDGKTSYDQFEKTFDSVYDNQRENKTMKFLRLLDCLFGEPKQTILRIPVTDAGYDEARLILKEKYGGSMRDARRLLREATNWPHLEENEQGMSEFRNFVQSIVTSLDGTDSAGELGDGTLFQTLCEKLANTRRERYFAWLLDDVIEPSVRSLLQYLKRIDQVRTSCAEFSTNRQIPQRPRHPIPQPQYNQPRFTSLYGGVRSQSWGARFSPPTRFGHGFAGAPRYQGPIVPPPRYPGPRPTEPQPPTYDLRPRQRNDQFCDICNVHNHSIPTCRKFLNYTVEERWNCAKQHGLCFRCLLGKHGGKECKNFKNCTKCNGTHHSLLHQDRAHAASANTDSESEKTKMTNPIKREQMEKINRPVSFRTLTVYAIANGIKVKCNLVFDECSNRSYVTEDLARQLCLDIDPTPSTISVLNGSSVKIDSDVASFTVASIDGRSSVNILAKTCPKPVLGSYRPINWAKEGKRFPHLIACKFYPPAQPLQVDILIGANHAKLHTSR
ncbi:MAG: DUF1759 domain-containing protein, partial [Nitrosomonadaceae bacterium]